MSINFLDQIKPLYGIDTLQGYTDADMKLFCDRFGALPQVLKEYYRVAGRTRAFLDLNDNSWILPEAQDFGNYLQQTGYLILLEHNGKVCHAGLRSEDLCLPDPPVYSTGDWKNWGICAPSVSEFLAAVLVYEAVFKFEYAKGYYQLMQRDVEIVQSKLTRFPCELTGWVGGRRITFYQSERDNMVAVMECEEDNYLIRYGAASEASCNRLHMILKGSGVLGCV